jgi:hypothetical protein
VNDALHVVLLTHAVLFARWFPSGADTNPHLPVPQSESFVQTQL